MSYKKYVLAAFIVMAFAVLFQLAPVRAADLAPLAAGTVAPEFQLNAQDGKPIDLKALRGQWVVLYFYPKDFSSGCTLEAHSFENDLAQYQDAHAVVLGVSVDSAGSHKSFCAKEGLNFKLLADEDHKVSASYGSLMERKGLAIALRNTFIIDPSGKIVKTFTGVHPDHHSTEVLAALQALQKK